MPRPTQDRPHHPTIGQRIRDRRVLLGLSIRGAALAAGLSHATWSRIERGERSANNRFVLARMAQAMRCPVADLTGERAVPDAREAATTKAAVTDAFRAVIAADPEYSATASSSEAPPLKLLKERVSAIRRLRVACDYAKALQLVPETVSGLHAHLNGPEWRDAMRLLILAEEATASIVRHQGSVHAFAMITERMRDIARRLEEPVMVSLAAFQRANAAAACGVYSYSRTIASGTAEMLAQHGNEQGASEMLGMLLLSSAYACYGMGTPGDATAYAEEAKRLAERTGDTMTLSLFFGPTNIRIWELSMEVDGGDPGRAVALARKTEPQRVLHVGRRATYHLDYGRALAYLGRDDEALRSLRPPEVRSAGR